jgi:hypothetical protein
MRERWRALTPFPVEAVIEVLRPLQVQRLSLKVGDGAGEAHLLLEASLIIGPVAFGHDVAPFPRSAFAALLSAAERHPVSVVCAEPPKPAPMPASRR